jgi:hypothetical protein
VHELKHDGHPLIVRRDGPVVRLLTRRGRFCSANPERFERMEQSLIARLEAFRRGIKNAN